MQRILSSEASSAKPDLPLSHKLRRAMAKIDRAYCGGRDRSQAADEASSAESHQSFQLELVAKDRGLPEVSAELGETNYFLSQEMPFTV